MAANRALLIGAESYGRKFASVPSVPADLEMIASGLASRGFECERVPPAITANASDLERRISGFCQQCQPGDRHVIYFSGHGIAFEGRDYIVPAGVSRDEARRGRQIVPTDFSQLVNERGTGHVLFIIDACRDPADSEPGAVQMGFGGRKVEDENRFVRFLGCSKGEQSWTTGTGTNEISVFTKALAEVLLAGEATSLPEVLKATASGCQELAEYEDRIQKPRLDLGALGGEAVDELEFFPREPVTVDREWLELGSDDATWVLVLQSEGAKKKLSKIVEKSLKTQREAIGQQTKAKPLDENLRVVDITEALESPERLLRLVEALCKAPVFIADASDFEAGVMLCLGVRAVVRRGITLTATMRAIDESKLPELPFNIQQTRLIGCAGDTKHPQHGLNLIGSALADGLRQLREDPGYLDLPGFDSVRCLEPPLHPQSVQNTVLVLCPFAEEYRELWAYLSNLLDPESERLIPGSIAPQIVRTVDMASPRLVGPVLYQHLRWSKACVADWSRFRANVFFELGVRLTCCEFPPAHFVAEEEEQRVRRTGLAQHVQLLELFRPAVYQPGDEEGTRVEEAIGKYQSVLRREYKGPRSELEPSAIYDNAVDWYDWRQEDSTLPPDEEMRRLIESQMGKDPHKSGKSATLFSGNKEHLKALRSVWEERWIAAWRYLRTRYSDDRIAESPELQNRLESLGEQVKLWLSKRKHPGVFDEIADFSRKFSTDARATKGGESHAGTAGGGTQSQDHGQESPE